VLSGDAARKETSLPQDILDAIFAKLEHPVKILRKFRGLTQEQLAAAANLSRPYLTEIETGKKEGSITALKALSAALEIPAGLLV
jgi:DNA-binding XRE family transcriptional regulator